MKLEDADPWLGDIVRGPDGTTARVDGTEACPDGTYWVYAAREDGSRVKWREGETVFVTSCEDVPLVTRYGRREPRIQ